MNHCKSVFYLIILLTMAQMTGGCARSLQIEGWENWNAASQSLFPAEQWKQYETPEEAGWSSEKLSAIQEMTDKAGSAAVMVIYNGAILTQWGEIDRRFMSHSVRKSLLSALYGIGVDEGHIDIDETIGSIGIDDISPLTEIEKSAKVSDLLKSRSGVYLPAASETRSSKENRPGRGSHKPGTHWYYNNWDFNTLATIYNKKAPDDLFKAFETQIADPLQMQDFELYHTYYHLEPKNSRHPAYPFRTSARDLARFGLLYLNEGRWKNEQIVPSEWVQESTETYSTLRNGGYGYMWWTTPETSQLGKLGTYAAFGYGGHVVYVVPGANLVFVHRANTYEGKRKHVNNQFIKNVLLEVLKARTGSPQLTPKLITLNNPEIEAPSHTLSKAQTSGLVGEYVKGGFVVTVREVDQQLKVTSSHWGAYFLFPKTATEFEVEDAKKRVEFELDTTGRATAIRIWFNPDEPYEMHRVGNDNPEQ